jgi:hypothetical protein
VTAIAIAFAVPQSRAAILRFFHLGAATVQLVERLPAAQERPLTAGLGAAVPAATARATLNGWLLLPRLTPPPPLHVANGVVSIVFRYHSAVVLLSEVYDREGVVLRKAVGSGTHLVPVQVGRSRGLWLNGAAHVFVFPNAPPRLAHNVLLWHQGRITLRLEGRHLRETVATTFARSLS